MAEGWLFRLRSTLGAQHAVPAWPAGREGTGDPMPSLRDADATAPATPDETLAIPPEPTAPR